MGLAYTTTARSYSPAGTPLTSERAVGGEFHEPVPECAQVREAFRRLVPGVPPALAGVEPGGATSGGGVMPGSRRTR